MMISVIMIDGGFRERAHGAAFFANQSFSGRHEVIWVEYYTEAHPDARSAEGVRVVTLGRPREETYHASRCFNRGIREARGEILVLPDGDLIVRPDFLERVAAWHAEYDRLALYGYRYNEPEAGTLADLSFEELDAKCVCNNPRNYGACLSVRKKWLEAINGYDEHPVFEGGFHANGYDIATRLGIYGLAIQWEPTLRLYHPWHPFTLANDAGYRAQFALAERRLKDLDPRPFRGLEPGGDRPDRDLPADIAAAGAKESGPEPFRSRLRRAARALRGR